MKHIDRVTARPCRSQRVRPRHRLGRLSAGPSITEVAVQVPELGSLGLFGIECGFGSGRHEIENALS